jgi:hypothetical protein
MMRKTRKNQSNDYQIYAIPCVLRKYAFFVFALQIKFIRHYHLEQWMTTASTLTFRPF